MTGIYSSINVLLKLDVLPMQTILIVQQIICIISPITHFTYFTYYSTLKISKYNLVEVLVSTMNSQDFPQQSTPRKIIKYFLNSSIKQKQIF